MSVDLPRLSALLPRVAGSGVCGYVYGMLFKADPKVCACAFAAARASKHLIFALANPLFRGDGARRSIAINLATSTGVNIVSIIAYRRLGLISTLGTVVLSTFSIVNIISNASTLYRNEAAD